MDRTLLVIFAVVASLAFLICGPGKPGTSEAEEISPREYAPAIWGKVYPLQYESWLRTKDPKPAGKSTYKRGWDDDKIVYDKLSEFPFLGLLYHGWGFGIEYNQPRGHYYAVRDQLEIDPSRVSPGGVCLGCKSPFHKEMTEKHGMDYLKKPFRDAVAMLPEKHRELGPACIDCHQPDPMSLKIKKAHLDDGLRMIGKKNPGRRELRMLACAQCHVTYFVPRDEQMKVSADITLPWKNGQWGDISIEGIIDDLLSDDSRLEWTQEVTGFKMPFIRHPEFELFSRGSVHFKAGAACADCHMPSIRVDKHRISDHDVTSPLKADLQACLQCHTQSKEVLRERVSHIQDRTLSLILRAGYATAACAKLFEILHEARAQGVIVDGAIYNFAKDSYTQAFLRVVFISAENSTGFHNPVEAGRVLGDAVAFAGRAEGLLRQMLAGAGMDPGLETPLELGKYLNCRGEEGLGFEPDQEFEDPFGIQEFFLSEETKGLP